MRKGRTMKNNKKETIWAYLCSAPSLLLILLIVVFPILYTASAHTVDCAEHGAAVGNCLCAGQSFEHTGF